jgi:hypothetical protein
MVLDLGQIQVARAEEQIADRRQTHLGRYHHERDPWDVPPGREPAQPQPHSWCLADGCHRRAVWMYGSGLYCRLHRLSVLRDGTVVREHELAAYEEAATDVAG